MVATQSINTIQSIETLWTPSNETGFLPAATPTTPAELATSNEADLRALGSIASKLGSLSDDEIEEFVAELQLEPNAEPERFSPADCEAIVRAYVNLAAHLIHRPKFATRKELPPMVARPLWAFSNYVNRPPSLTYASYVLANFTSIGLNHRTAPADLKIAQTPSGTADEEWFVAVHLSIESAGGEVVRAISSIENALTAGDNSTLVTAIEAIHSCMVFSKDIMPTVYERLRPDVFRNDIRPLLYGHDRIFFCGVEGNPTVTYIGETGAQSGIIRAVDAILGINHSKGMTASMGRFLECAPPPHQRYFRHADAVGQRLAKEMNGDNVRNARREALHALADFRRTHLRVVSGYLIPEGRSLTDRGTGGTEFQIWLKQLIDEAEIAAMA